MRAHRLVPWLVLLVVSIAPALAGAGQPGRSRGRKVKREAPPPSARVSYKADRSVRATRRPSRTRALAAETEAITDFLEKNWDVTLERGTAPELVEYVLRRGRVLGDRTGRAALRSDLRHANRLTERVNEIAEREGGRRLEPLGIDLGDRPVPDLREDTLRVHRAVVKRFGVSARHRGPMPDKEYARSILAPFAGARLHPTFPPWTRSFADAMSAVSVQRASRMGISPLATMLEAVLRQGMTLELDHLHRTQGALIAGRIAEASAILDAYRYGPEP